MVSVKTTRIEIRVIGRWNACALLTRLAPYRSFLIQQGPDRWVVHAETPGCRGQDVEAAMAEVEACLDERGIEETSIRIDGKPCRARATAGSRS